MLQVLLGRLDSLPHDGRHLPVWNPLIEAHPDSQALRVGLAKEAAATGYRDGLAVLRLSVTAATCLVWWKVVFERTPVDKDNPHGKIMLAPQLTGRAVDCACPGCE